MPIVMRGFAACLMLCLALMLKAQRVDVEYHWITPDGVQPVATQSVAIDADGNVDFEIPAGNIPYGANYIVIRAKVCDSIGVAHYSPALIRPVSHRTAESGAVQQVEYFWDVDPGFGNATPLSITPAAQVEIDAGIDVPDTLANGVHLLSVRAKSVKGWSPILERQVVVKRSAVNNIVRVEYFWDTDPGYGKGGELPFTASADSISVETDVVPADTLSGVHTLYVRALSSEGQWSPVCATSVNVGIEGSFTLNETLPEGTERNFVSLSELFELLLTDEVRDNIEVTVRDGATFEYDATDSVALAHAVESKAKLDQYGKHILFKASGDTVTALSFKSAVADKSRMLGLIASFMSENVTIMLNGVEYDFNALYDGEQEICSGDSSDEIDMSQLSADEDVTVAWSVKPHDGMVVEGYEENGTGTIPAMTLTNHKKAVDYVEYDIVLLNNSDTLTVKNHKIQVYTRVSEKSFTSMKPQAGAVLDPKAQTLSWTGILGADSYRVYIAKRLTAVPDSLVAADTVVVTVPSYKLDVEGGYSYTWHVTAYGHCDSLQSAENSFSGRLLPDLSAAFVEVPEYAFGGAPFSIQAVVTNNGEGATVEKSWNDVLYYSLTSSDISTATKLASVTHSGNIVAGESYTVTFETVLPEADEGSIYLFVTTDAAGSVMELDDENNTSVSPAIDCRPFIMNAEAHLALTTFYNAFDGDNWTNKWNITSDNITKENYPGVTFNADGIPVAIVLENNGLAGDVTGVAIDLPQLATLDLSKNSLTGDVAALAELMPQLTSLDLSYNKLNGLSGALPSAITSLNLNYQYRTTSNYFMAMDSIAPVKIMIGETADELRNRMVGELHAVDMYNHTAGDFSYKPDYAVYDVDEAGKGTNCGSVNYNSVIDSYRISAKSINYYDYNLGQDHTMMLANNSSGSWARGSACPAVVSWKPGDSNMDAIIDVLDVQHTLNELLGTRSKTTAEKGFNYAAADLNFDEVYNILDVVKAVNIVLENQNESSQSAEMLMASGSQAAEAIVFASGNMIVLKSSADVAAIDVTLSGVTSAQIRQKLSKTDFQVLTRNAGTGVRVVIFSPTGSVIPSGETVLFTMSNYGVPTSIKCADAQADEIKAKVSNAQSSVSSILDGGAIKVSMSNGKLFVTCAEPIGMGHVEVYSTAGSRVHISNEVEFKQETMQFATRLNDGVYIVKVIADEDCYIGKIKE